MIACLWSAEWADGGALPVAERLAGEAPRLAVGQGVIWADARGLDARALAARLRVLALRGGQLPVGAAISPVAIAAEVAARRAAQPDAEVQVVLDARAFMAPLPIGELVADASLVTMLDALGIAECGALAALEREAIEVRFGPALIDAWRAARGEDTRRLFLPPPPEPLHASVDYIDYVVSDAERLIFSVNALLGGMCERLRLAGEHARRATLTLSLANRTTWTRTLRPARPTGSRNAWLRLARGVLERITIPDSVTGIALVFDATESASAVQGDLFDPGFASANAVEAALARLIEAQGADLIVEPEVSRHPLAERRTEWRARDGDATAGSRPAGAAAGATSSSTADADLTPGLALQLLPQPREVLVETVRRRDHVVPVRYRDGQWRQLVTAAGPDRISGGRWEDKPYAREYFRAVTVDGLLVWLFRDARTDTWFLQGWWD